MLGLLVLKSLILLGIVVELSFNSAIRALEKVLVRGLAEESVVSESGFSALLTDILKLLTEDASLMLLRLRTKYDLEWSDSNLHLGFNRLSNRRVLVTDRCKLSLLEAAVVGTQYSICSSISTVQRMILQNPRRSRSRV